MCYCENVEIGSYDNQVKLRAPEWSEHEHICVDTCIVPEIKHLWGHGIVTTGCCCGHNLKIPYISVRFDMVDAMISLGYTNMFNPLYPDNDTIFHSKSIEIIPEMVAEYTRYVINHLAWEEWSERDK